MANDAYGGPPGARPRTSGKEIPLKPMKVLLVVALMRVQVTLNDISTRMNREQNALKTVMVAAYLAHL
jgi:hypothetical protein